MNIDATKAAQVWQRVLAGREGFENPEWKMPAWTPGCEGDLPQVRTKPPGIADWQTYAVFPPQKKKPANRSRAASVSPLALLALLWIVAQFSGSASQKPLSRQKENPPSK